MTTIAGIGLLSIPTLGSALAVMPTGGAVSKLVSTTGAGADEPPASILSLSDYAQGVLSGQAAAPMPGNSESSGEIALKLLQSIAGYIGETGGMKAAERAISDPGSGQNSSPLSATPAASTAGLAGQGAAGGAAGELGNHLQPGEVIVDQTITYADGSTGRVNFNAANYYDEPSNQTAEEAAPSWLSPDQRASFIAAYNNGTLNIQNAFDVQGLNYHQAFGESANGQSQAGTDSQDKLAMNNYFVWGSMDGAAYFVSW